MRLATYESADEAKVMEGLFVGRSGEVENTTFGILTPDGKQQLLRAGRGPRQMFRNRDPAQGLADKMNEIAKRYATKAKSKDAEKVLPVVKDVRLALNVAACDNVPLVIALGKDKKSVAALETNLTPTAWEPSLAGQCSYVLCDDVKELSKITGRKATAGVIVVQPDTFGLTGKVLAEIAPTVKGDALVKALTAALAKADMPAKEHHDHVRKGRRAGVEWETEIPVTDPGANKARERGERGGRRSR